MGLAISLWRAGYVRVFFRCGACFFAVAGGCFACWAVVSFLSGCSFSERLFPLPRLSLLRRPPEDLVGLLIRA